MPKNKKQNKKQVFKYELNEYPALYQADTTGHQHTYQANQGYAGHKREDLLSQRNSYNLIFRSKCAEVAIKGRYIMSDNQIISDPGEK